MVIPDATGDSGVAPAAPIRGLASPIERGKLSWIPLGYVAGPFRAPNSWEIEQNIRRAETLALEVWRAGAACICPHANTRFFQGAADDDVWLLGDLEILRRCDFLITTGDWTRSSGARAEVTEARRLGLPVFADVACLRRWLATGETA